MSRRKETRGVDPQRSAKLEPHSSHVTTIGVRRPDYGSAGKAFTVLTNNFRVTIPGRIIVHYDVGMSPETILHQNLGALTSGITSDFSSNLSPRVRQLLLNTLEVTKRTAFDGRKNLFAPNELALGESNSKTFDVSLPSTGQPFPNRPPKVYQVTIKKVNQINLHVLSQYVGGKLSHNEDVLNAITALNIVIRAEPSQRPRFTFNVRSFYTDKETKDIGFGVVLWRGFFQSIRPAIGQMVLNVDVSTAAMYKSGPLIQLCLAFFNRSDSNFLAHLENRERLRLQRFLSGVKISATHTANTRPNAPPRTIKRLSTAGASATSFFLENGTKMTVAAYFHSQENRPLRFPHIFCVEVMSGALIPLEKCEVIPGQVIKKQLPSDPTGKLTKAMVEFSTINPIPRFDSIQKGVDSVFAYDRSEYVDAFGMKIDNSFLSTTARILAPPSLQYGRGSSQPILKSSDIHNGSWNMIDKKFFKPMRMGRWIIVSYASTNYFNENHAKQMTKDLVKACENVGIVVDYKIPMIKYENGQGSISQQLRAAGAAVVEEAYNATGRREGPNIIVVILPEGGNDIYTAVKQ
ncbi:hypothetical protein H0H92_004265 [Tricholoma furcatifolium]|nr:hypothetical protein H0H92_004265 [Tricholoma furcatifolium]